MAEGRQENAFLKFDPPFKGKATAKGHEGEVVVEDLSFDIAQTGKWEESSSDSGRVTQFGDVSFRKECDNASPALFKACAMKTQFKNATINIKSGENVVFKLALEKVIITNAGLNFVAGQDNPEESYTLSYKKIDWEKGTEKTGFDLETNQGK